MDTLWSGAGTFFHQEACFREHDYYAGRFWDKYVLAVYRNEMAEVLPRLGLSTSLPDHARRQDLAATAAGRESARADLATHVER